MTTFTRLRLLVPFLVLASPALHATPPASGSWTEKTQEMAGGLVLRNIQAEACYAPGKSGVLAHVNRAAQRLIDSSCNSEAESRFDEVRFEVHCGGAAFGDGVATVQVNDEQSLRINITFHNNATGLDMDFQTDASWKGPDCRGGQ